MAFAPVWPHASKGVSPRARAYQEQISGHSYDDASWVGGVGRNSGGVKFDGYKEITAIHTLARPLVP